MISTEPNPTFLIQREQLNQVVGRLKPAFGLQKLKWKKTDVPLVDYLKTQVKSIDFDQLLKGVEEDVYLKLIGAEKDDKGRLTFSNFSNADFFRPHATNNTMKLISDLETRLQEAVDSGIITADRIDKDLLERLKQDGRDISIFYSQRLIDSHNTSLDKVYAAEIGHVIAKSFGFPVAIEIEEAFDRVSQMTLGSPTPHLTEQERAIIISEKAEDDKMIGEYETHFAKARDLRDAHLSKLIDMASTMFGPDKMEDWLDQVYPSLQYLKGIPIPTLEEFCGLGHSSVSYLFDARHEHLRGDYIIEELHRILGGDLRATDQLPRVLVNAMLARNNNTVPISVVNFDRFTQSVLAHLSQLNN